MSFDVSGYVSVHVSGLPLDCDDAVVEKQLRETLDKPIGTCGLLALENEPNFVPLEERPVPSGGPKQTEGNSATTVGVDTCAKETGASEPAANMTEESDTAAEGDGGMPVGTVVEKHDQHDNHEEQFEVTVDSSEATSLSESCYSCSVPRKKTGEGKGFCFLEFVNLAAAEAAVRILNAEVQISGSVVSAQLAKQNASATALQADQYNKGKKKAAKHNRTEAVYMPQLQIKSRDQGYGKGLNTLAPPLRKKNPRPLAEEKKATTYLKAMTQIPAASTEPAAMLCLKDGVNQLALKNQKR